MKAPFKNESKAETFPRSERTKQNAIDVVQMSDAADELSHVRDSMMMFAPSGGPPCGGVICITAVGRVRV